MNIDNINPLMGNIIKAHTKPIEQVDNGKHCTYKKECLQHIADWDCHKKLCSHYKSNWKDEQK